MGKRRVIDVLAERHSEWVKMADSFNGIRTRDAEEIVQGMYLKMHDYVKDVDRIMYKDSGEVNTFYVWTTMRNLFHSGYHINGNKGKFNAKNTVIVPDVFGEYDDDWSSDLSSEDVLRLKEVGEDSETIEERESDINSRWMFESLFGNLEDEIDCVINSWGWYDCKMYKLYYYKGMSMRQIAKATGISLKSVFLTLKACKARLREYFQDDYNNYKETLKTK